MRPRAMGAVAEGHKQSQEHIRGDSADGGETDVGGEVQNCEAHGQHQLEMMFSSRISNYDVRSHDFVWKNANWLDSERLTRRSGGESPTRRRRVEGAVRPPQAGGPYNGASERVLG